MFALAGLPCCTNTTCSIIIYPPSVSFLGPLLPHSCTLNSNRHALLLNHWFEFSSSLSLATVCGEYQQGVVGSLHFDPLAMHCTTCANGFVELDIIHQILSLITLPSLDRSRLSVRPHHTSIPEIQHPWHKQYRVLPASCEYYFYKNRPFAHAEVLPCSTIGLTLLIGAMFLYPLNLP